MPITVSDTIDAPISDVWAIISDYAGLKRWHPMLVRCETTGEGEGAVRTVYFDDWWAAERLDRLDKDAHLLAYSVTDSDRKINIGATGQMKLFDIDGKSTRLDWTSGLKDDHPDAAAVNGALKTYYPTRFNHLRAVLGLPTKD